MNLRQPHRSQMMANRTTQTDKAARVLTFLAWASIAVLILLTIVPADERPTTPLSHSVEHIAAFAIAGTLVGLSFRLPLFALSASAVAFAGCLELLQVMIPTRHARLIDFFDNSLGSWIGLAIGLWLSAIVLRRGD